MINIGVQEAQKALWGQIYTQTYRANMAYLETIHAFIGGAVESLIPVRDASMEASDIARQLADSALQHLEKLSH